MPIHPPTARQIQDIAEEYGIGLTQPDAQSFVGLMAGLTAAYDRLDAMSEPTLPVKYPRTPGWRPAPQENPFNAWTYRTDIKGAPDGKLAGKRIAVKDNICLAGVPMMNGSRVLEGYVPEVDATVVTRILDAGGTIIGKTTCEDLCFSGGSHTSKPLPVLNPRKPTHSAGGSSSGSAAVLAAGEADMALGGDQGGSIRMPAAWCGIYGLKATHGLVPYTGVFPIELTLDHCGPMANSVADIALLLSVTAGPDGLDPRQIGVRTGDYMEAAGHDARGLKIALVKEGFGRPESDKAVDRAVRDAAAALGRSGATVEEVSVPMHIAGYDIWSAIIVEGSAALMINGNGFGTNWDGHYVTSLLDAYARGWRSRPHDMAETVKTVLFFGEYARRFYHGRFYAKAQNLRRSLRAAYDAVLQSYDVMLMPTIPFPATPLPEPGCSREDYVTLALNMVTNTAPFDASGHPAISVPCGQVDGLPVGMMLIGRRFDEATVLRAAAAYERLQAGR
ncbi:MAG TPA: amidase [Acetobacteraceae bacterium]|nr:amidase [Acetobacteraceae bacterium]